MPTMTKRTAKAKAAKTWRGKRRPKRAAIRTRRAIVAAMKSRGVNALQLADLAKVPDSVVYDFLGPKKRDLMLSNAERIWTAVGLDLRDLPQAVPQAKVTRKPKAATAKE